MANAEKVYVDLQKHLDEQAVGFPATKSGVEIRILKELFSPAQASLALLLNYQPQSAQDIYKQVKESGISFEELSSRLKEMESNGAIGSMERNGTEYYFTIPLLVGIVELHEHKATPRFWANFSEYSNGEFGEAYASTKVSQMRTIPVQKSLRVEHHVSTYDDIRDLINSTDGPITVHPCMCREGAHKRGQSCHVTSRSKTCMGFGDWARRAVKAGARALTREEALEIVRQNEADGLVLQPTNYQKIDFVCACCGCCCGVLKRQKLLPKPAASWAHNFSAAVETEKCTACGTCVEKCQMQAVKIDEQNSYSMIDMDRCIGCGNCVAACPSEALRLVKLQEQTAPPEDCTALYKILAER